MRLFLPSFSEQRGGLSVLKVENLIALSDAILCSALRQIYLMCAVFHISQLHVLTAGKYVLFLHQHVTFRSSLSLSEPLHPFSPPTHSRLYMVSCNSRVVLLEHASLLCTGATMYACSALYVLGSKVLGPPGRRYI